MCYLFYIMHNHIMPSKVCSRWADIGHNMGGGGGGGGRDHEAKMNMPEHF